MKTSPALRACVLLACAFASVASRRLTAQPAAARGGQSQPPTRAPDAPGAPPFMRLEGRRVNPPANTTATYIFGPDYVTSTLQCNTSRLET
jgi:hypothetical protein